jgi:mRNA-degrading endonuclease toxin of MazEF toxin-antitoxin module
MNWQPKEIWEIERPDPQGHEQAGKRPGVILAISYGMTIVIPFTTKTQLASHPHAHLIFPDAQNNLPHESVAMCFQIMSISGNCIKRKIGVLSDSDYEAILEVVKDMLQT